MDTRTGRLFCVLKPNSGLDDLANGFPSRCVDTIPRARVLVAKVTKWTPGGFSPDAPRRSEERRTASNASLDPNLCFRGMATSCLRALLRWPSVEDGAQSLFIEPQTKPVFLRKLSDLSLSILLVYRPNPFQVPVVNQGVLPFAMHP